MLRAPGNPEDRSWLIAYLEDVEEDLWTAVFEGAQIAEGAIKVAFASNIDNPSVSEVFRECSQPRIL